MATISHLELLIKLKWINSAYCILIKNLYKKLVIVEVKCLYFLCKYFRGS